MASSLPDYVASARPVPLANRAAWFLNTAPTYAGIMLWFVFWQDVPVGKNLHAQYGEWPAFAGGILSQGLLVAFAGLILAAAICHFLFYLVPGLLGLKTGLPLYIVGTSTYGVNGGFLMPGFLMGVLQFGWLGVNAFSAGVLLCAPFGYGPLTVPHAVVATVWAVLAAFVGLKGVQYVARVASFFPLVPLAILLVLFAFSARGLGTFSAKMVTADTEGMTRDIKESKFVLDRVPGEDPLKQQKDKENKITTSTYRAQWVEVEKSQTLEVKPPLSPWGVIALLTTYVVGFFATAGAAGADFGMNSRNAKDVQLGGLVGIALATIFAGGLALLISAGGQALLRAPGAEFEPGALRCTSLMDAIVGSRWSGTFMYLLAIAAFPPACFSSFIAANSFKTTLPRVNPFLSVGIGTAVAALLAISGIAGDVVGMFLLIGASFGPVCGAMAADFLLAERKWAGPRAGFNLAGWISWVVGFLVGAADFIPLTRGYVPCPPVMAFLVGFALYAVLARVGLQGASLEMPAGSVETPPEGPANA